MSYQILSDISLTALANQVRIVEERGPGAKIHGAPFYNQETRMWCQALDVPIKSKDVVKLREPADKKSS